MTDCFENILECEYIADTTKSVTELMTQNYVLIIIFILLSFLSNLDLYIYLPDKIAQTGAIINIKTIIFETTYSVRIKLIKEYK